MKFVLRAKPKAWRTGHLDGAAQDPNAGGAQSEKGSHDVPGY